MPKQINADKIYFKQLDGLRCIAVMSVLICHWITYHFVVLIPLGSMGVNLFFVLSGFLITRILLINKMENGIKSIFIPIKQFYIRRTLRIFPIYYLTIFFLLLINFPAARENMGWLLTYTFNIKFSLSHVWESNQLGYLTHLWSLSVEEQFYLLFPFLIFLVPHSKIKWFIITTIIIAVLSRFLLYAIHAPQNSIYVLTPACLDAFGIGGLLAYYILYYPEYLKKILAKNYLFAVIVLLFIGSIIYSRKYIEGYGECRTVTERFLFSACCFWIVGKATLNNYTGWFKRFLESKNVIYIGKISYGIYIYHYFAEPLFMRTGKFYEKFTIQTHNDMMAKAVLYFTATLIIASASWFFIETPINKIKDKFKYSI